MHWKSLFQNLTFYLQKNQKPKTFSHLLGKKPEILKFLFQKKMIFESIKCQEVG